MLGKIGPIEYVELAGQAMKLLGLRDEDRLTRGQEARFHGLVESLMRCRRARERGDARFRRSISSALGRIRVSDSPIESILRDALLEIGIDWRLTKIQHRIGPYKIDIAVPSVKLAVECDGRDYHTSPADRERDRLRDDYLANLGWRTRRFRGRDIFHTPSKCAELVSRDIDVLRKAQVSAHHTPEELITFFRT